MNEIKKVLESSEKVEWEGKPKANSYFVNQIVGLILFGGFGGVILFLTKDQNTNYMYYIYGLIGLVVLSLISGILNYRVTYYAVTNKRIILQSGIIGRDFKFMDYDQIKNVSVNVGLIDKIFKTGAIRFYTGETEVVGSENRRTVPKFSGFNQIENPYELAKKVQTHLSKRKENLYGGRT